MFKFSFSVTRFCALAFVAAFWTLAVWLAPPARAQTLQNASIQQPSVMSYSAKPETMNSSQSLFQSETSPQALTLPNLNLAYDNWPSAQDQVAKLTGGVLSVDFDPAQASPQADLRKGYVPLKRMQEMGLKALRLKVNVFAQMDELGQISPGYLDALETTVNQALDTGAIVILTEANGYECSKLPEACEVPLLEAWTQIGNRLRHAPPRLMFELLTDPAERLTPAKWNPLLARVVARVRESNPMRNLLVPPAHASAKGEALADLNALNLPEADRHLILSVRYNDPMAANAPVRDAQSFGLKAAAADMNEMAAWSRHKDRPLLLNEIGVEDTELMRYRTHWIAGVIRMAQDKGFGWGLGEGARKLDAHDLNLRDFDALQQASGRSAQISGR